jgi:hypothetical protein
MPGQDTTATIPGSMEDLLEAEGDAHPEPSPRAGEVAAEFGERLAADLPDSARAPSPGQPIYPPGFDPNLHAWPPDKTARGTWRRKRPGDASAPSPVIESAHTPTQDPAQATAPDLGATPAQKAEHYLDTGVGVASMILGEHWRPNETEAAELRAKFTRFMEARNLPDLPPGWALLAVVCAYALPRVLAIPKVQAWMQAHGLAAGGDVPQVPAMPAAAAAVGGNGDTHTQGSD